MVERIEDAAHAMIRNCLRNWHKGRQTDRQTET